MKRLSFYVLLALTISGNILADCTKEYQNEVRLKTIPNTIYMEDVAVLGVSAYMVGAVSGSGSVLLTSAGIATTTLQKKQELEAVRSVLQLINESKIGTGPELSKVTEVLNDALLTSTTPERVAEIINEANEDRTLCEGSLLKRDELIELVAIRL